MPIKKDISDKIITMVDREVSEWQDANVFVTDKIAFHMRNLIKKLRKNFWGIFDKPNDPSAGNKKIWIPLTESVVDTVVKNIDLDTKDINIRAKKADAIHLTSIVRQIVNNSLEEMEFGQLLDDLEQTVAIDGTAVWKTIEVVGSDGKKHAKVIPVDLLNFYIDPASENIQESDIIERSLMTQEEFMSMDGWENKEDVVATTEAHRTDRDLSNSAGNTKSTPLIEVYERWGKIPKDLLTGKESDKDKWVESHVVVSGIGNGGAVHLIEENKNTDLIGRPVKPYEECWYKRVKSRWYGRGVAEKVMWMQLWMNTTVNIRIARARVSQLGLFKVRANSGITQSMLSRLTVNGVVKVKDMGDIEQMIVQEASAASYRDEETAGSWAQRVTSAFESVTGEQLPASTPATNAVLASRGAQSEFVKVKEQVGFFLQRWMTRQILPIIARNIKRDDILRVTGDIRDLQETDKYLVNSLLAKEVQKMNTEGRIFDIDKVRKMQEKMLTKLKSQKDQRFFKLTDKPDFTQYDLKVFITNEEIDKSVLVQNLISVLQTVSAAPDSGLDPRMILEQIYDVMGLDVSQLRKEQSPPELQQLLAAAQGQTAGGVQNATAGQIPSQAGPPTGTPPLPSAATIQQAATTV